jgi:hypothetical protein
VEKKPSSQKVDLDRLKKAKTPRYSSFSIFGKPHAGYRPNITPELVHWTENTYLAPLMPDAHKRPDYRFVFVVEALNGL